MFCVMCFICVVSIVNANSLKILGENIKKKTKKQNIKKYGNKKKTKKKQL